MTIKPFNKAKKRNFLKGLPHNICPKIQNYLLLFLGHNQPRNNVSQCSRLKKKLFPTIKITTFQKASRSIPKGLTHDFCRKMQNFLLLFLNKMSLEIMFHYVLDKKKNYLEKKKKFYSSKNRNFPKGFTHDFCQKIQKFSFIFFRAK